MLRAFVAICLLSGPVGAGLIHGVVIEHASSHALARTRVRLSVIREGKLARLVESMTSRGGQFAFPRLPDGQYILTASRPGYLDLEYGQRRPGAPGVLIPVSEDTALFTELRMRKLGAITGRLVDENLVALTGVNVIAYRAELPLQAAGNGKTDDRGVYRIAGLPPGRYWVRNAALELEDGSGLLPTFLPGALETREAKVLPAMLDNDTLDVDYMPAPGHLLRMAGKVTGCLEGAVRVVLSSDTGRREVLTSCGATFRFEGLAPGNYELTGEAGTGRLATAAFREIYLDQDNFAADLNLSIFPGIFVQLGGPGGGRLSKTAVLTARRRDPAGSGEGVVLQNALAPGYYEIFVEPPPGYYLAKFSSDFDRRRNPRRLASALAPEVFVPQSGAVFMYVTLSDKPGAVSGTVVRGSAPSPGVPVFLYPTDSDVWRRGHGYRTLFTDGSGAFRFADVPPGEYLLASSIELDEINETTLREARAKSIRVEEGRVETVSLDLHVVD